MGKVFKYNKKKIDTKEEQQNYRLSQDLKQHNWLVSKLKKSSEKKVIKIEKSNKELKTFKIPNCEVKRKLSLPVSINLERLSSNLSSDLLNKKFKKYTIKNVEKKVEPKLKLVKPIILSLKNTSSKNRNNSEKRFSQKCESFPRNVRLRENSKVDRNIPKIIDNQIPNIEENNNNILNNMSIPNNANLKKPDCTLNMEDQIKNTNIMTPPLIIDEKKSSDEEMSFVKDKDVAEKNEGEQITLTKDSLCELIIRILTKLLKANGQTTDRNKIMTNLEYELNKTGTTKNQTIVLVDNDVEKNAAVDDSPNNYDKLFKQSQLNKIILSELRIILEQHLTAEVEHQIKVGNTKEKIIHLFFEIFPILFHAIYKKKQNTDNLQPPLNKNNQTKQINATKTSVGELPASSSAQFNSNQAVPENSLKKYPDLIAMQSNVTRVNQRRDSETFNDMTSVVAPVAPQVPPHCPIHSMPYKTTNDYIDYSALQHSKANYCKMNEMETRPLKPSKQVCQRYSRNDPRSYVPIYRPTNNEPVHQRTTTLPLMRRQDYPQNHYHDRTSQEAQWSLQYQRQRSAKFERMQRPSFGYAMDAQMAEQHVNMQEAQLSMQGPQANMHGSQVNMHGSQVNMHGSQINMQRRF